MIVRLALLLLLAFAFAACVPSEFGQKQATCGENEAFDPVKRKCYSVYIPPLPPVANLEELNLVGERTTAVTLTYKDNQKDLARFCSVVPSADLSASVCTCSDGVCSVALTSAMYFYGQTTFSYTVTDKDGVSNSKTVNVLVSAINHAPQATVTATGLVVAQGTGYVDWDLSKTATDADRWGDSLVFGFTQASSYGTLSTSGLFTLYRDASLSDNIRYAYSSSYMGMRFVAQNPGVAGNSIRINLVSGTAGAVSVSGTTITVGISSGVTTGSQIQTAIAASASASSLVRVALLYDLPISPVSSLALSSGRDYTDYFIYKAHDSGTPIYYTQAITATISIPHTINTAPSLNISTVQSFATSFETALNFVLSKNATDVNFLDSLVYSVVTPVAYGTLNNCLGSSSDLSCTYTPGAGVSDEDTYPRAILGGLRFVAITPGTATPTISYVTGGTAGYESVSVSGNVITVEIEPGVSTSSMIKTAIEANTSASAQVRIYLIGNIFEVASSVTLAGGRALTDYFTYEVCDNHGDCSATTATVAFSISPTDHVPTIATAGQAVTTPEDTSLTFALTDLGADVDLTDELTYEIVTAPSHGTLSGCLGGTSSLICTYLPNENYNGTDTFTFKAKDKAGNYSGVSGTVTITVTFVDDPPKICQYSTFDEASECGWGGCVGSTSPVGRIMPSKTDIYYYQTDEAICWKSTGAGANDWQEVQSHIASQVVNEKDTIVVDSIRIDEGGGSGEDSQTVQIDSVTLTKISGETGLLTPSSITFTYNSATVTVGAVLDGASSSDTSDLKMTIIPVGGKYGKQQVDMVIKDSLGSTSTVAFTVEVYPVSVQHKGWTDVVALGPKVNKDGDLAAATFTCNYSRSDCTIGGTYNQACTGDFNPTATTASTSLQYAIFYNSTSGTCWVNTSSTATATWVGLTTVCNISPSYAYSTSTTQASLIGSGAPALTPARADDSYYDITNDVCYRSLAAGGTWEVYSQTTPVTLTWETPQVSGSGSISGYNVFRKLKGESAFNYKRPINRAVLGSGILSYTDNAENSWFAPVPKTIYEYEVRPVINSISTAAYGSAQVLTVPVPPNNMALMHRWVANKTMCTKIFSTPDPLNNYRCVYQGPGDNGAGYYDVGSSYFVDVNEAGCPYSASPACTFTNDKTCVGKGDPSGAISGVSTAYYYDRSSAQCWYHNGTAWGKVTAATPIASNYNFSKLPPLVNVTQDEADTFCSSQQVTNIVGTTTATGRLPNRKLQLAYGQWSSSLTDTEIINLERGDEMLSSPKCNTYSANKLTDFSDEDIPDSNSFHTLPGTLSSGIRSLITGSSKTSTCVSRYGIQDAIGNVGEWTQDRLKCTTIAECEALSSTAGGIDLDNGLMGRDTGSTTFTYKLGDYGGPYSLSPFFPSGPCANSLSGYCQDYVTNWLLTEKKFNSSRFWVPIGLPGHTNFTIGSYPSSSVVSWLFQIGESAGILDEALHEDYVSFNTQEIFSGYDAVNANSTGTGGMYTGGSYLTTGQFATGAAGLYHFDFAPLYTPYGYLVAGNIVLKAKGSTLPSLTIVTGAAAGSANVSSVVGSLITLQIDSGVTTGATAVAALNASGAVSAMAVATVTGSTTEAQGELAETAMSSATKATKSVDRGFRCVYKVP